MENLNSTILKTFTKNVFLTVYSKPKLNIIETFFNNQNVTVEKIP